MDAKPAPAANPRASKRLTIVLGVVGGILLVPIALVVLLVASMLLTTDAGSVRTAAEFERAVAGVDSAEKAAGLGADGHFYRFPSGEWVVVMARDSHGGRFSGGGTVVLRDSEGRVTWLHGHVCGAGGGPWGEACGSLADFYERVERMEYGSLPRPESATGP